MRADKKIKQKIISVAVMIALMITLALTAFSGFFGDVDGNGKVQATDARRILRHAAKVEMFTDEQSLFLADIDGNGKIAAADARRALRMASRIDPLIEVPTEEATTAAPTTETPATAVTTTVAPTTAAPATDEATTAAPATDEATTAAPATDEATTAAPVTEEPTTEEPTTKELTTEEPTTEEPTTEEPTTEEPTTEEPTTEEPTTEEPTTEEPTTEEPTTEEPTTEEPTTEEPITEIVFGAWKELNEKEHQRVCLSDPSIVETEEHSWDEGKITKEAGCEEDGEKTFTCKVCGAVKAEAIPAAGHDYGEWTKLDENKHQRVCANDASHVETADHNWDEGVVTKEPAVGEEGEKQFTCKDCGAVKNESIAALPDPGVVNTDSEVTEERDGMIVTKLPYTVKGLTVDSISFKETLLNTQAFVKVTNGTGKAIGGLSSIEYKCYNADGTILESGSLYLENLNDGESCKVSFYLDEGTVKILFGDATIFDGKETEAGETGEIDGIQVTKLPYAVDGLTVNSVSFKETFSIIEATVNVTNGTGKAIEKLSNIAYKCYDADGTIIKSGSLYLEDLNDGESCNVSFYLEEGTAKILFGEAQIYEGKDSGSGETEEINGIQVTKLPYTVDGLTVNSVTFDDKKISVNVTNGTGKAIDHLSNIAYKCYDADGNIVKSGSMYLEDLNDGENCNVSFYLEEGTVKLLFGEAQIYEGTVTTDGETEEIDGIQVTKLPYTVDGLTVISFKYDGSKTTVKVKNGTGKAIDSLSNIAYKCYDADGNIVKSGSMYLVDMNDGESCSVSFYLEEGTVKLLFGEAKIYDGKETIVGETEEIDGIQVTKLPYENAAGFTVNSVKIDDDKVTLNVTNDSSMDIDHPNSYGYISYACYDADGTILKTGALSLEEMKTGEKSEVSFYMEKDTAKIVFTDAYFITY